MTQKVENIEKVISKSSIWDKLMSFIDLKLYENESQTIVITVGFILLIVIAFLLTNIILSLVRRVVTRKLPKQDKDKFITVFSFSKWFIYLIVLLIAFTTIGVNLNALVAASAGLMIGVGLALQTFFQDIISGIFILIDQSVHVGDIIEIDDKIGRVDEIKLRTTRAVTVDNKVIVIPNHLYLTNSLYNWTQNGTNTRETVRVGVSYGSDVQLVEKLLIEAANSHPLVLEKETTLVRFMDFGDSSLDFMVVYTVNDSFNAWVSRSDIRFEIDRLFRENNVTIPFPQRDIHIIQK